MSSRECRGAVDAVGHDVWLWLRPQDALSMLSQCLVVVVSITASRLWLYHQVRLVVKDFFAFVVKRAGCDWSDRGESARVNMRCKGLSGYLWVTVSSLPVRVSLVSPASVGLSGMLCWPWNGPACGGSGLLSCMGRYGCVCYGYVHGGLCLNGVTALSNRW